MAQLLTVCALNYYTSGFNGSSVCALQILAHNSSKNWRVNWENFNNFIITIQPFDDTNNSIFGGLIHLIVC